MTERHVVLGAGGAIASATLAALKAIGADVIAIGHSEADARDPDALTPHLIGASHVYLCIGLPYVGAVWERDWPAVMRSVLKACEAVGARLIFFDNVYMYGPPPLSNPITEDHQQAPTTRKGRVRKVVADMALQAHAAGRVRVVIGRSADFYGPGAINSFFYIQFLENLLAGKKPMTLLPQGPRHTYAYTLDNGRALVRLALDDGAYGSVWHLPTGPAVTVEEMADHFRKALGRDFIVSHLPSFMISLLGIFSRPIREVAEMDYQFRQDYVLDWSRFADRYPDFRPTPYLEGVKSMVDYFRSRQA